MKINEFEERMKGHARITKSIISTPFDLKTEIKKLEVKNMNKPKNITWLKRVGALAAVVTICAITVVSADAIKGFFKDIVRWDGAIVGTEYVNATNDIKITTLDVIDEREDVILPLNVIFEDSNVAPFSFIEEIAITEYRVLDVGNKEVFGVDTNIEDGVKGKVENGKILIELPMNEADLNLNEKYIIEISNIYVLSKADQPLRMSGNWKCEFIR